MKLNELNSQIGSKKDRKRVGRGIASGTGKTAGRGVKGQKARSGVTIKGEGGQMPIVRRMPKRGFNSINKVVHQVINLNKLQKAIDDKKISASKVVSKDDLQKAGLIHTTKKPVSLLAYGDLKSKLTIQVDRASASAMEVVTKLGGKVELLVKKKEAA